jgi:hypothetical protein
MIQKKYSRCETEESAQKKSYPESIKLKGNPNNAPNPIDFEARKNGSHPYAATMQLKLKGGAPNDAYEKEADAVADKVIRLQESDI